MGFWSKFLVAGTTAFVINWLGKYEEKHEKEDRRKNISCRFTERLTEKQFEELAFEVVKHIKKKRIDIEVHGALVYGNVTSQSGLTEWAFTIDFNDYGSVTGKYWLWVENKDSIIPETIANEMQTQIQDLLDKSGEIENDALCEEDAETDTSESNYDNYEHQESVEKDEEIRRLRNQNKRLKKENKKIKNEHRREVIKKIWKVFLVGLSVIILVGFVTYQVSELKKLIPVGMSSEEMKGLQYEDVANKLKATGFSNVQLEALDDLKIEDEKQEGMVEQVVIDDVHSFKATKKFSYEDEVVIRYHTVKEIYPPISSEDAEGKRYKDIVEKFEKAGFVNVKARPIYDLVVGWFNSDEEVDEILIDGDNDISTYSLFRPDAEVIIKYHTFKKNKK